MRGWLQSPPVKHTSPIFRVAAGLTVVCAPIAFGGAAASGASFAGLHPSGPTGECDGVDQTAIADLPVAEAAEQLDDLSTLTAAIVASDIDDQLEQEGPFTIFAPSNDAFDAIPENVFESIVADLDLLSSILGYHVVVGEAFSVDQLADVGTVETISGPLEVTLDGDMLVVNGDANVTCAGIRTADATIYVIDRVLQPPSSDITTGGSSLPGSSIPGSSVPGSSVPASSIPGSSVTGSSVPGSSLPQ